MTAEANRRLRLSGRMSTLHTALCRWQGQKGEPTVNMKSIVRLSLIVLLVSGIEPARGQQWIVRSSGVTADLMEVSFADTLTGVAVGTGGAIVRTTDGGATWSRVTSGTDHHLHGVAFATPDVVYADGDSGVVLRSSDRGLTWGAVTNAFRLTLWGSTFLDERTGIIAGNQGDAVRTTDAGVTWESLKTGSTNILYDVSFATRTSGTIVGRSGEIYHTSNRGDSWVAQDGGTGGLSLFGVTFSDSLHGYAVGEFGTIRATSDGGATWQSQASLVIDTLLSVCARSTRCAIAVGRRGQVIYTFDGGVNWQRDSTATVLDLNEVTNAGWNKAVAVGERGVIMTKVFPDAPTGVADALVPPDGYALLGNYPNPFNGETMIRFRSPGGSAEVRLDVLDLLGRSVGELYRGVPGAGEHAVPFRASHLASGAYIVRLIGGGAVLTRQILMTK